ncbi:MAG: hypothetical protein DYG98_17535 [Haliscomenobacteraceae bacterium CHB4]|nr:hypothetical protein [Haliscomenobacteraceae bacterium CHB4]
MKNIPLADFRLLFPFLFLLVLHFGCRKEIFLPPEEIAQVVANSPNYPISVEEAQVFYSNARLSQVNSVANDAKPFVRLEPVWDQAYSSLTLSGREIIVVPLADSSIRVNNQGRADAKLLFRKVSTDSIVARILLYAADSVYHASQGYTLNFNNFTGVFALFDLTFNFEDGVVVESGVPVKSVDSASVVPRGEVLDREEVECDQVTDVFVYTTCVIAYTNNYCYEVADTYIWWDCHPTGGGGSTGGGGTSTGGNGGGSSNTSPTITYWDVFSGQIPVGAFTGSLPPGFDMQLFQQLVDIVIANHLSANQVDWLMDHSDFIPVIWNASGPNQTGEEWAAIVPVLDFAIEHKLIVDQYHFLIYHPDVFESLAIFLVQHTGDNKAEQLADALLVFTQNLVGLTLDELNFLYDNIDGIEEATSEPTNPPITAARLICADILTFAIRTDELTNFQYAGMYLTDAYYGFTVPGVGTPTLFHLKDMRLTAYANSANTSCLPSSPAFAANAINLAVSQTQQLFNGLPPVPPSDDTIDALRAAFLLTLDREFRNQIRNCNSAYTGSTYLFGLSDNWDNLPIVNCDFQIPNCP